MVLILESRSHLDLGDLPNMLAAELGVMTVRLERAVRSLDGVARVHVNRWGDGSAHLHLWFLARPYGRLQLRGTFLSLWDEILPPIPEYQWRENLALVAAWLAEFGGRPLAEPPRIDWKSPATLSPVASAPPPGEGADGVPTEDGASTAGANGAPASGGTDDPSTSALPDEFATARDIRVVPGPAGFSSIVEAPAQDSHQDREESRNPARSVPGQREGSAHDRDSSAATPA
jgi:hypothetical protein